MSHNGVVARDQAAIDHLLDRLSEPRTAAALETMLDNAELLAVIVAGLDGVARKGEIIGDTLAEVLGQVRAAAQSSGLNPAKTTEQLATLIPTLADASPAINRILESPIIEPEPIAVLSEAAEALVSGFEAAQRNQTKVGVRGLMMALRDDDVQRGLGFVLEVAKALGRDFRPGANTRTVGTTDGKD
jgi:hypothetical protein